jgi:hypothetical protein
MREIECFISIMHCGRQAESLISQFIALSMRAGKGAFQFHQTTEKIEHDVTRRTHIEDLYMG